MRSSVRSGIVDQIAAIVLLLLIAIVLVGAAAEFYNVAAGTGAWIGDMSFKWALAFALFGVFGLFCLIGAAWILWVPAMLGDTPRKVAALRDRLGPVRFFLAGAILILPVWFLQFSPWGVVFSKTYVRLFLWIIAGLLAGVLLTRNAAQLISWPPFLAATLLSGTVFALAVPLMGVTAYPFSLGWSEGNRLWDYSLLFGSHLYQVVPGSQPAAYLDPGRQLVGGLPFIFAHVSILGERLWLAGLSVLPYLVLGWIMFWPGGRTPNRTWILAGVWSFLFLSQGPIHTPLLGVAALVAVAWRIPRWPAALLVAISAYFGEVSRFTWVFAPAIWIVMLELGCCETQDGSIPRTAWSRAITLGLAGLLGGALAVAAGLAPGGTSIATTAAASTKQPLLWYRLFPNATYGSGILLGLLIAAAPMTSLLLLLSQRFWHRKWLQLVVIGLPLLAFLVVGLIVSAKIGGGGDLHNLDMLLIGLLFVAAALWRGGGARWILEIQHAGIFYRALTIALIAIPAYQPLTEMRPLSFSGDTGWLTVLADVQRPRDLGSLPDQTTVNASLTSLQQAVNEAQVRGPVLFMDQRQLLTFGFVTNVELVPDFEKKRMMDEALSGSLAYFQPFYDELAAHRFSLIISSPLRTPIKDSDYGFGEENNAWVKWVARPVLCYYTEQDTLVDVKVELLVPRTTPTDCTNALP